MRCPSCKQKLRLVYINKKKYRTWHYECGCDVWKKLKKQGDK